MCVRFIHRNRCQKWQKWYHSYGIIQCLNWQLFIYAVKIRQGLPYILWRAVIVYIHRYNSIECIQRIYACSTISNDKEIHTITLWFLALNLPIYAWQEKHRVWELKARHSDNALLTFWLVIGNINQKAKHSLILHSKIGMHFSCISIYIVVQPLWIVCQIQ